MRFLLVASLAAAAIVLVSRKKKADENAQSEEEDYDEDTIVDDYNTDEEDFDNEERFNSDSDLYSEPSSLTIPEKHEGDVDNFNRPEYISDNKPDLTVDALRRESNA